MMKIGFIHSTRLVLPWIEEAVSPFLSELSILHALDESLIVELAKGEGVTQGVERRIVWLAASLIEAGAERLVLSCSSLSPAVDIIAPRLCIPLIKIDAAMIRAAIIASLSENCPFVILATNPSTRIPIQLIVEQETAKLSGSQIRLEEALIRSAASANYYSGKGHATFVPDWSYRLLDGAFEALNRGDTSSHDAEVVSACEKCAEQGTRIYFAQVSMARILPALSTKARAVVNTSLDFIEETLGLSENNS